MLIANKATAVALAGLLMTATGAFAQVGGGNEMPNAAKDKGTASGGTEGKSMQSNGSMSQDGGAMKQGGMMKKDGGSVEKSTGKM